MRAVLQSYSSWLVRVAEALAAGVLAVFIIYPLARLTLEVAEIPGGLAALAAQLASQSTLILQSTAQAAATAFCSTALALCIACASVWGGRRFSRLLRGLCVLSIVSPPFVASLSYLMLFGRRGLITYGIFRLSINPYGWHGVVIMQSLFFAAINVLMLITVLERLRPSLALAARDLGATPTRVLLDMTVPLMRPTIMACLLLTFMRALSDFGTPVVIGGSFDTIASAIYVHIVGYANLPLAALLNVALMTCALVVFVLYRMLARRTQRLLSSAGLTAASLDGMPYAQAAGLPRAVRWCVRLISVCYVVCMVALVATMVRTAFVRGISWDAPFTLDNVMHLREFSLEPLVRSVIVSLAAAATATVIAALLAWQIHTRGGWLGRALEFVSTLPYLIPGSCFGLAYLVAFSAEPLLLAGTSFILIAVLVCKQLTIAEQSFAGALTQLNPELMLATRDLGATEVQSLVDVVLPQLTRPALVALVNTFSTSMFAYSAVLFLVTAGHKIAIFEVFDALSSGKYGQAALVSLVLLAITMLVNSGLALAVRSSHQPSNLQPSNRQSPGHQLSNYQSSSHQSSSLQSLQKGADYNA